MKADAQKSDTSFFSQLKKRFLNTLYTVRRAFKEFLLWPTIIILCFLLLIVLSSSLDSGRAAWIGPFRSFMKAHIFADAQATSSLLSSIASGIITVASLTITLLLLVVQQTASTMTTQVFDQFLRARQNQIYFGFFIGLALYTLVVLSTVSDGLNPVIGASFVLLLTVVALYLLVVLIYTTIYEMRPAVIIAAIRNHVINSRKKQQQLIAQTRRIAQYAGTVNSPIYTRQHGYVTHINTNKIHLAIKKLATEMEVVLEVAIGHFVAYGDKIAYVVGADVKDTEKISQVVQEAIRIELQRDIDMDPNDGINQLETIAWTSISTAKSNPQPGLLTIRSLRDIWARWVEQKDEPPKEIYPIVYNDDVPDKLLNTFETLAIVASESMQHQTFIEVLRTFKTLYGRLNGVQKKRVEDIILRILSAMGDFVLTAPLEAELKALAAALAATPQAGATTVQAIERAYGEFKQSVGTFNSRSTRVPNK